MEAINIGISNADTLRTLWQRLRSEQPGLRIRNAAERLGVSELSLLLTEPADRVRRLGPEFADIYVSLGLLGPVMTLARNDQVVHETTGRVGKFSVSDNGAMGLCLGDIDLRVFFNKWAHGYAVTEQTAKGERQSLQFFDHHGVAVHKIYAVAETDMEAWQSLIGNRLADVQRPDLELTPPPSPERRPAPMNVTLLREDWASITDVHQFHDMLKRHDLDRLTALECIGDEWARRLPAVALEQVLDAAGRAAIPLMVFVGNRGIVQIHTGAVNKLVRIREWFNVLDPHFNLHVSMPGIHSCWAVRRPSADGDITSLDCFNQQGELVLSLFGERKPGRPELAVWRQLVWPDTEVDHA